MLAFAQYANLKEMWTSHARNTRDRLFAFFSHLLVRLWLKLLAEAEEQMQGAETNSQEWRNSLVNEAEASTKLGLASQLQVL